MNATVTCLETAYHRIKWRLFPLLYACYIFSHLDRVNISFAKLQFMPALGLSEAGYGFAAGLFFLGYLLFEVPSNLYLQKAGARLTFSRIMILWGLISASMYLIKTPTQLYFARFLLGAAEAGFFPGLILYLTYWFSSGHRARITSLFLSGNAVAGIIGGPLSGWIMKSFGGNAGLQAGNGFSSWKDCPPSSSASRSSPSSMTARKKFAGSRARSARPCSTTSPPTGRSKTCVIMAP